ncbi:MAG TPA: hypothetical protein VFZ12_04385 [Dehalococcoidia bacterium]|nr:hypothetical protein [Dehalococcoidia bacterium]
MPDRMLLVSNWMVGPTCCDAWAGPHTFLELLRRDFEVEIYEWPTTRGRADPSARWEDAVAEIASALPQDGHVVAIFGGAAFTMLAMSKRDDVRLKSFVVDGFLVPAGALRDAGMDQAAQASAAAFQQPRAYQYVAQAMLGAAEPEIRRIADVFDREIDWTLANEFAAGFEHMRLFEGRATVTCPALYLEPHIDFPGFSGTRELFLKFAPDARSGELTLWPSYLHLTEAGHELAEQALAFALSHAHIGSPDSST